MTNSHTLAQECTPDEIATRQSRISTRTENFQTQVPFGEAKPRANTASNRPDQGRRSPESLESNAPEKQLKRSIPELVRFMNREAFHPRFLTHAVHDVPVHRTCHGLVYVFRNVVAV